VTITRRMVPPPVKPIEPYEQIEITKPGERIWAVLLTEENFTSVVRHLRLEVVQHIDASVKYARTPGGERWPIGQYRVRFASLYNHTSNLWPKEAFEKTHLAGGE